MALIGWGRRSARAAIAVWSSCRSRGVILLARIGGAAADARMPQCASTGRVGHPRSRQGRASFFDAVLFISKLVASRCRRDGPARDWPTQRRFVLAIGGLTALSRPARFPVLAAHYDRQPSGIVSKLRGSLSA